MLTATTALALVGGAAFAEITISGDAKLGMDYSSEPGMNMSKHSFKHEMGVDFSGSGTTDGGLSFGGKAGFDTGYLETNTGNVWVSGAFGKVTIGDNDAADLLAGGIADVGLNGQGVDDVAEDIRGTSAAQFRYDQSVGNIALAISAGTGTSVAGTGNTAPAATPWRTIAGTDIAKKNSYAIGMSFTASGATFGIGYDSGKTISAGFGYSTGQISANAFYAKGEKPSHHHGSNGSAEDTPATDSTRDGMFDAGFTGLGLDVSYTMGASTLTMVYAKTDVGNIQPVIDTDSNATFGSASFKGMGIGFSHDLGGEAKLVAGFAQVPQKVVGKLGVAELGQQWVPNADSTATEAATADTRPGINGDKNVASVGLSFSF